MSRGDELIAHYLDGTLSEDNGAELETWLHADAANLRKFVVATVREEQLRAAVVSREALCATTEVQAVSGVGRRRNRSRSVIVAWTVAASLLAVVSWIAVPRGNIDSVLTLVQTSGQVSLGDEGGNVSRLKATDRFTTGTLVVYGEGARAKFSYANGSTFSLSGGSEMNLSSGDRKRLILRRGTLLASVSPQPAGQPLIVRTATAEAVVLGTSFGINATESETRLQVSRGAVSLRRLSDDQTTTVNMNEQIRAGISADRPLHAEPISLLPLDWRAVPATSTTWLGEWSETGILRATPQTVFLKESGIEETHFHAGVANSYPGLVRLNSNSVARIRFRIDRPQNLGLFVSTHAVSWDFTGNFQAYVEGAKTPADEEGWRTATVPMGSFLPMGERLPFQPDCVVSTVYATTWANNVGLEVAEFEIVSMTGNK